MFCVECGAEGPTVEGLCAACFTRKHRVVEPPAHLDVEQCQTCGAFHLGGTWTRTDLDLAIAHALREQTRALPPFRRAAFTHLARKEDERNYLLTVKASGVHEGLTVVQDFHVRLRLKPSICDTCQKKTGRYYEGILQVRGDGRDLTPREIRAVRTLVLSRIDRGREAGDFSSRVEEIDGGLDFYVSSNALGARLAREVAEAFGGTVSASPKLYGRRKGREVYRVTSLVRLPPFQVGDVVRRKDVLAEVLEVRPFVQLRDLASGEVRRYKAKDLRGLRRIDAERFEAELRPGEGQGLVAVHPETGEERALASKVPPGRGRAVVVWTSGAAYLSALEAVASKD